MNSNPTNVKLAAEGGTLAIEWDDGHRSAFPYAYLRDRCPCATCTDRPAAGEGLAAVGSGPPLPASLPILGPGGPLKPQRAELVGHYALQIFWSDGHSTGIYTFDYLRENCPCPECSGSSQSF